MVMLISITGLLLMSGLQRQLDAAIRMANDERHYLQAFNQASSSLSWALSLRWRDEDVGWQCQTLAAENLKSCVRTASDEGQWLLRGEGILPASARPLMLYQRAVSLTSVSGHVTLQSVSHGWLDFCPDKDWARCADME
ncbi:YgdB family protein [Brenneria sp. 4F2]|nr:YgdB family protein [Brenneria bubanii]